MYTSFNQFQSCVHVSIVLVCLVISQLYVKIIISGYLYIKILQRLILHLGLILIFAKENAF